MVDLRSGGGHEVVAAGLMVDEAAARQHAQIDMSALECVPEALREEERHYVEDRGTAVVAGIEVAAEVIGVVGDEDYHAGEVSERK